MKNFSFHEGKVVKISQLLKDNLQKKDKRKIRFSHGSTNSTRVQDKTDNYIINISSLNQILKIDKKQKIAIVEPNVPMDTLVDECLKFGLLPKVIMEFPGITCGGGINGAALEASSYIYGQFNDTCIEYECILGDGTILTANKNENTDLYYGISSSYGSLALLTLITISLIPAKPYVFVNFLPVTTKNVVSELQRIIQKKFHAYLDAIIFNTSDAVIITGDLFDDISHSLFTFTKATDEWFYIYAKQTLKNKKPSKISVPVKDFIFRYDRGAFWMGKYAFDIFRTPFNRLTRTILDPLIHTRTMYKALHKTNMAQKLFIQDFYIPLSKTNCFIDFTIEQLQIFPLWLCPIKSTNTPQYLSPHYLEEEILIDVGVWGNILPEKDTTQINKLFEEYIQKIGGRKMLYAEMFYNEDFFWQIYNHEAYNKLRYKYKAIQVFPTVWEKTHVKKRYSINKWKGVVETMGELLKNKFTMGEKEN